MAHRTLSGPIDRVDPPVKGSRFAGHAAPVATEEAALAVVADLKAAHRDATHHAWAYRLQSDRHRHHDDGEPGGSAGRPILAQIEGHDLVDVVVVVVRWYGGTKLGVGGLIRAYGGCAGRTLDAGEIVQRVRHRTLRVTHPYDDTGAVSGVIGASDAVVLDTRWDAEVTVVVWVPDPDLQALIERLRDRTSGRVVLSIDDGP